MYSVTLFATCLLASQGRSAPTESAKDVVDRVLKTSPIFDGHNDVAFILRETFMNDLRKGDMRDFSTHPYWYNTLAARTDIARMKKGGYGGQFWSAYTQCKTQLKDSVEQTLEQIDIIKRFTKKYSDDLYWATSVKDIQDARKAGKIASLIGVEGGHSIQGNYGILRLFYELGVRYLTLTHDCNTPWADSARVDAIPPQNYLASEHNGLSSWGLGLIDEMNRLGMMVDLSHVSEGTMRAALKRSRAPIIFSHSGAKGVYNHVRNVPDDVLQLVKSTDSIVMINFYANYLKRNGSDVGTTVDDVVAHAEYIRKIAGIDNIGIGGDYDGVNDYPTGMEDVSKVRNLLEALYLKGWTEEDLGKMSWGNIVRVMGKVEQVRDSLIAEDPKEDPIFVGEYWNVHGVTSNFL